MSVGIPFEGPPLVRWLRGGHAQTLWPALFAGAYPAERPSFSRTSLSTPDGDRLTLDWLAQPEGPAPGSQSPLLVLFHGLEGSSGSGYALAYGAIAAQQRWRYVVPHFRGCGGELNQAPRAYHSGDVDEIDFILRSLLQQHDGPLYAVGVSLGGNALMRWAGEQGDAASRLIQAAAAISAPLDLAAAGAAIDQGFNRALYARVFLSTMKKKALAKHRQYPGLFDLKRVLEATRLRDFDDAFTAPLHGFAGVDDYWQRASAKPWLRGLRLPALLVNAQNDPLIPAASLPSHSDISETVMLYQPTEGGHVGFTAAATRGVGGQLWEMAHRVCGWLDQSARRQEG